MAPSNPPPSAARRPSFALPLAAWAVMAAVVAVSLLLFELGRAPRSDQRLADVEQSLATAARRTAAARPAGARPAPTVCAGVLYPGYRDQLNRSLATSGIEVVDLSVGGATGRGEGVPLDAYPVRLIARGSYVSAISALSILARAQPSLIVDHVALRNQTSSVNLMLEGRVFCRSRKSS